VYVLDREEFIRDIAADFIGMEGYATKSFGSAEKMFNSTEQPDLLLVGVGNEYDSPADGLQIARARWPSPLCQRHVRQLPLDISVLTGGEWCHDRAEAIPSS
jgi:hypothetical protein